jgi:hypothetical protein
MRLFMKKRSIILLLCFIVTSGIILLYYQYHKIIAEGSEVSEKRLVRDIKILTDRKLKIANFQIFSNHGKRGGENGVVKEIYLNTKNTYKGDYEQPLEVELAFKIWLYLSERKPPYEITHVTVTFRRSWAMVAEDEATISKVEFNSIYSQVYNSELLEKELIQEMTRLWILQNNYQLNPSRT